LSSKISQAGEDQIVEAGKRTKSLIFGERAVRCALPRRMCSNLGEGADGVGDSLAYGFDACHERGGNGAHAGIITPSLPWAGSIVYPAPLLSRPDNFTSTKAFFSSFTLRAGDFFSFAIVWLLPCRTVGCSNQVCSRIGCALANARLDPRETRFNGVCGALGGYWVPGG